MRFVSIACLLVVGTIQAQEFATRAARTAKADFEKEVISAKEDYEKELDVARAKYVKALDEAAVKAAENGDLDDVVLIKKVKDDLSKASEKSNSNKSTTSKRVLWKHKKGYFEKLNDGHWVERVGNGAANIFAQSTVNDQYIEISRAGAIVRMYNNRAEVLLKGRKGFQTFYNGSWEERD